MTYIRILTVFLSIITLIIPTWPKEPILIRIIIISTGLHTPIWKIPVLMSTGLLPTIWAITLNDKLRELR